VPPALREFGQVLVLEPRRLAARMAARRVAEQFGETPGESVGYQVRFEEVASSRTWLRFLTEGVLTRRLLADPELARAGCVVFDEFHERHLDGDFSLALVRRLQRRRPDLRVVVMSATLDGDAVSRYLGGCPVIRSEGRLHPVEVRFTPHSAASLEEQVRTALDNLLPQDTFGHVLVFLPGAAEIQRCLRACQPLAARYRLRLLPLHGDLPPEQQDLAVLPCPERKLILSTNVAESSITIEGVTAVIDSGLARVASDSPWTGIPSLNVARISKASARQRAGRAGRTGPGLVIRLYSAEDFARRPEANTAEVLRRELSQLVLDLHAMEIPVSDVPWFEPPPEPALQAAEELLGRLHAFEHCRELAQLPLHPRLAALVHYGRSDDACTLAAAFSLGERAPDGDVLSLLDSGLGQQTRRLASQLRRMVRPTDSDGASLLRALLRAFPDRVARRRGEDQYLLSSGGSALLRQARHEWIVALDVEERRERELPLIRLAAPIEPDWLLDHFPERIAERNEVQWNRTAERVEATSALLYDNLVVTESRSGAVDPEMAAQLLAEKASQAGVERFTDRDKWDAFLARCDFCSRHAPFLPSGINEAVERACRGLRSFGELCQVDWIGAQLASMTSAQRRQLDEVAPEHVLLPSGRRARIHYSRDQGPWVESRLQDFFGMQESPRVARGQVQLVLRLLAPNQRPVQVTTDLAGFWKNHYPQVRRELARRYPKHSWPETP
jgi:ATP-dependent helicase HrpB